MKQAELLPEREGQPDVLTMAQPHEVESGHWYSPAAVREKINAAVAAERERCAKLADEYATLGGSNFAAWFEKLAAAIRAVEPSHEDSPA